MKVFRSLMLVIVMVMGFAVMGCSSNNSNGTADAVQDVPGTDVANDVPVTHDVPGADVANDVPVTHDVPGADVANDVPGTDVVNDVPVTHDVPGTDVANDVPVTHDVPGTDVANDVPVTHDVPGTDVANDVPVTHDIPGADVANDVPVTNDIPGADVVNDVPVTNDIPGADVANDVPDAQAPQFTSIHAIQASSDSTDCSGKPHEVGSVLLTDVVLAGPVFSETSYLWGMYIQSQNAQATYNGILVTALQSKFADLDKTLAKGDTVTIAGTYKEFYCESEIVATQITKTGHVGSNFTFETVPLDPSKLLKGGTSADLEPYEGMVVSVTGDFYVAQVGVKHSWVALDVKGNDSGNPDNYIYVSKEALYGQTNGLLKQGDMLSGVKGALQFSFGKYQIAPFSPDDITMATD